MLRRSSTAATHNISTCLNKRHHFLCKFLRSHIINSNTVFKFRKSGIWLCHNRNICIFCHCLYNFNHLIRTRRTVHTNRIGSKCCHNKCRRLRICSIKSSSVLIKCECYHYGKFTDFFSRYNCCPALLKTHHCFNYYKINPCINNTLYLLLVYVDQLFKHKRSDRINLFSRHSYVTGNVNFSVCFFFFISKPFFNSRL